MSGMLEFLFGLLNSLRKRTPFDLGLVCVKDGDPHSESFSISSIPSINKFPASFLNIYSCNFGTGYGLKHIGFVSSFI